VTAELGATPSFRDRPLFVEPVRRTSKACTAQRRIVRRPAAHRGVALSVCFFRLWRRGFFGACGLLVRCGPVARLGSTPACYRQIVVKPSPRKPPFAGVSNASLPRPRPVPACVSPEDPLRSKPGLSIPWPRSWAEGGVSYAWFVTTGFSVGSGSTEDTDDLIGFSFFFMSQVL
jgi:hypothetical protein